MEQRREHYRVSYPDGLKPSIFSDSNTLDVIDICSNSVKFTTDNAKEYSAGNAFTGQIKFYDDPEQVDCNGHIFRVSNNEVIVHLEKPITIKRIKLENLFLAYKFQLMLMNNTSSQHLI